MGTEKPTISFIWQGVSEDSVYYNWNDGLAVAMEILEEDYDIEYKEPWGDFNGDILLYWEAPVTYRGEDGEHYRRIQQDERPTALLFAGGEIKRKYIRGFDLFFTESQINDDEFERLGKDYIRAFGVNTDVFHPEDWPKHYVGAMHATFAGWKRFDLFAEALGEDGLAVGRRQKGDMKGFNACIENNVTVVPEIPRKPLNSLLNMAECVVNTSNFWGGGQRCTLEAMAAGLPVIVMDDSPKNREYVEESGCGVVCEPEPEAVREAIDEATSIDGEECREYVMSKWTPEHYAENLKKGINQLLS